MYWGLHLTLWEYNKNRFLTELLLLQTDKRKLAPMLPIFQPGT